MKYSERIATAYGTGRKLILRRNCQRNVKSPDIWHHTLFKPTDPDVQRYMQFKPTEHERVLTLERDGCTVHGLHVRLVWRTVYTDEQTTPFKAYTICAVHARKHVFICGKFGLTSCGVTGDVLSAQPSLTPQWPDEHMIQWLLGNVRGVAGSVDLDDWWRSLTVEFAHHWTVIAMAAMLNGTARQ